MAVSPAELERRRTGGNRPGTSGSYYASKYGSQGARAGATKYYGQSASERAAAAARAKVAAQQAAQGAFHRARTQEAAGIDEYQDNPLDPGGLTAAELAMIHGGVPSLGDPGGGGSGGGGRGGGGGGAGGAGVDPSIAAAMQAYLASINERKNPYEQDLSGMFSVDPINKRYDRMRGDVGSAGQTARGRLGDIAGALTSRVGQAGSQINQGFSNRIAALQQMAREFGGAQRGEAAGLNQILASNDAGSVAAEAAPLQNLFRAAQTSAGDARNMFQQSMADRASLSGQLQSDVGLGMSRDEQALMSQIAARRAAETSQMDDRRRQMEADLRVKGMDWQSQRDAEAAKLKLELAQLGIVI